MSEQTTMHVPQWDVADRLRKSLRDADVGVQEMADYLDVGRNTVSNWLNGHVKRPPTAAMKLWAMRCGVPYEWLRDGDVGNQSGDPGSGGGGLNLGSSGDSGRYLRPVRTLLATSVPFVAPVTDCHKAA